MAKSEAMRVEFLEVEGRPGLLMSKCPKCGGEVFLAHESFDGPLEITCERKPWGFAHELWKML